MQERGIISGTVGRIGGVQKNLTLGVGRGLLMGTLTGLACENSTGSALSFNIAGQPLTQVGKEVKKLATLKATDTLYLGEIAESILEQAAAAAAEGKLKISIVGQFGGEFHVIEEVKLPK
jgi:hypothetical protein